MPDKKKSTWRPAERLTINVKTPGYRTRWCDRDPMNIERKLAEGWRFVNATTGVIAEHDPGKDGDSLAGAKTYRELVLMALPEELGKERDKYIQEQTDLQAAGLKSRLEDEMKKGGGAEVRGKITIE